ncbi:MAG: helix-turn-helix domain-containing protein [Nitrosospira sp.]|nr:helix-turn-helix domain-containing protein [Nitrosospira sp.]
MESVKTLIEGMDDIIAFQEGRKELKTKSVTIPEIGVSEIRKQLNLTQEDFAQRFGFSVSTVRNWEQGTRQPDGPARILLSLIASNPETIATQIEELRTHAQKKAYANF